MRRLVSLALIGALAWWFLGRRRQDAEGSASIGFLDGSSVTLDTSSPELARLLEIAAGARIP